MKIIEVKLNQRFDYVIYSFKFDFLLLVVYFIVNDDFFNRIISGNVIIKFDVKCFIELVVEFDDGMIEDDIDVVFLVMGYIFGFLFLDKFVLEVKENWVYLYKWMFLLDLEYDMLVVIGCIQLLGVIMLIFE